MGIRDDPVRTRRLRRPCASCKRCPHCGMCGVIKKPATCGVLHSADRIVAHPLPTLRRTRPFPFSGASSGLGGTGNAPSAVAPRWLPPLDWCELASPTLHKHGPPLEHVRSHAVVSGFHGRTERRSFSNLVYLAASAPRIPRIVVDGVRRSRQKMWTSVFTP